MKTGPTGKDLRRGEPQGHRLQLTSDTAPCCARRGIGSPHRGLLWFQAQRPQCAEQAKICALVAGVCGGRGRGPSHTGVGGLQKILQAQNGDQRRALSRAEPAGMGEEVREPCLQEGSRATALASPRPVDKGVTDTQAL